MNIVRLIPIVFLCCMFASGDITNTKSLKEYDSISIQSHHSGWIFTFHPNGSVTAQYGSSVGNTGHLPKETVDFSALLSCLQYSLSQQSSSLTNTTYYVALQKKGASSTTAKPLIDDSIIRYLLAQFSKMEWTYFEELALKELMKQHPFIPFSKYK